jgi:GT2 family glycosyltransferase/SAM-dependent methyltransferase
VTVAQDIAGEESRGWTEDVGASRAPPRGDARSVGLFAGGAAHGIRITCEDDPVDASDDTCNEAAGARLHLQIVDRVADAGVVVVGWLSDPLDLLDGITVEAGAADPLDLAKAAATFVAPERHDLFYAPRAVPVTFGFVAFVADPSWDGHLGVTARLRTGGACRYAIANTGDSAQLAGLLKRAPLAYGLAVVAHVLSGYRACRARPGTMPPLLEGWAACVFERIDPQRDYGRGGGHSPVECYVDATTRIGTLGILIKGWLLKEDSDRIDAMAVVGLSGHRVPVPAPLPAVARPDVIKAKAGEIASRNRDCGFVVFTPIAGLDVDDRLWFIEIMMRSGAVRRIPFICGAEPAPLKGIETVVALAEAGALDLSDLFQRALSPPLEWFWSKAHRDRPVPTERVYGQPPHGAQVSIIVPLYRRIDFVRHQIASFANDPEFRAAAGMVELIYVLDDPDAAPELRRLCRLLHDIYGVSFRTVLLNGNFGYSAANNAGARAATGTLLLLLNSDVLPKRSRWVGQLAKLYATLDGCGVLGCRLLFEDGSIQHAAMSFRPSPIVPGAWGNDHRGKGLSTAFDPHAGPAAVAAVTGACLLIDRALFLDVGGMSEDYVIGDFEDSDLCLKVRERGLKTYYTPDVELYHLERQSMRLVGHGQEDWRQSLTLFNMWKHGQRWKSLIPIVAAQCGGTPGVPAHASVAADPPPATALRPSRAPAPADPVVPARPPGGSGQDAIQPGFLAAISPTPFRERLRQMCEQDPAVRVLSWMLGPEGMLAWGHCVGMLNDPVLAATLAPLPPPELRTITAAAEEQVFLWTGLFDVRYFLDLFDKHTEVPRGGRLRVLDFGCGCGRLTRFLDLHGGIAACASDINPDLAGWCGESLRNTRVELNQAAPPLAFEDGVFDLVFSLSVFTHLARDQTRQWLAELGRTLAPGGLLVVTTHGYPALQTIRGSSVHQDMFRVDAARTRDLITRLPQEGYIFLPYEPDVLSAAKAGAKYGNAFIDPDHVRAQWSSATLQFVAHVPGGLRDWQDVVVLRRS